MRRVFRVVNAIKKWIELNIEDWDRPELQKTFTNGIERMRGEGGHADQWANHLTDALVRAPLLCLGVRCFHFSFESFENSKNFELPPRALRLNFRVPCLRFALF